MGAKKKPSRRRVRVVPRSFALIGAAGVAVIPVLYACSNGPTGSREVLGVAARCLPNDPDCRDLGVAADPFCERNPTHPSCQPPDAGDAGDAADSSDSQDSADDGGDADAG